MAQQSALGAKKSDFRKRMELCLKSDVECQSFFEALDRLALKPGRGVRVNTRRSGALNALREICADLRPVPWDPHGFFVDEVAFAALVRSPLPGAGLVYVQEPGAMEAVNLLAPEPGEWCLDLCAAPGGKSTQIAERLGDRGWLVSNEVVRARAQRLDALVARHGLPRVTILSLDPSQVAELYPHTFDAILVDAPCSGESLFAKRIDVRSDVRDADVQGCARRQTHILADAFKLLRPGGRLVYSTCTYSLDENEAVVQKFLAAHADMELVREVRRWPHRDHVAGGYAALLRSTIEPMDSVVDRGEFAADPHGLLRHGTRQWNGETDLYASTMADAASSAPRVALNDVEAKNYLHGDSLNLADVPEKGFVRCFWREWPLGPGKSTEGRINNLLPKILRT